MPSYYYICVLIQLYMCPHTTTFLSSYYCIGVRHTTINWPSYYYICPHPTIYVSSYYYLCVLVLAHSPLLKTLSRMLLSGLSVILLYVSSYYCVLILLHMCPHTATCVCILLCALILLYICPYTNVCVLILLHMCLHTTMCPHTAIDVSSS